MFGISNAVQFSPWSGDASLIAWTISSNLTQHPKFFRDLRNQLRARGWNERRGSTRLESQPGSAFDWVHYKGKRKSHRIPDPPKATPPPPAAPPHPPLKWLAGPCPGWHARAGIDGTAPRAPPSFGPDAAVLGPYRWALAHPLGAPKPCRLKEKPTGLAELSAWTGLRCYRPQPPNTHTHGQSPAR